MDETSGNCRNCNAEIHLSNNFCNLCGARQNIEVSQFENKWADLKRLSFFLLLQVLCCLIPHLTDISNISSILFLDILMAVITLTFVIYGWDRKFNFLRWPKFSLIKLIFYILVAIIASLIVQFLATKLNLFFFKRTYSFYDVFAYHQYGKYLMILSIAVFPAIFEELAFRGYFLQKLSNAFGEIQAVYISSFLFFVIHFSLISVFWLLPLAILIGLLRIREKTIWYGVFIHFFFNLTACMVELYYLNDFPI